MKIPLSIWLFENTDGVWACEGRYRLREWEDLPRVLQERIATLRVAEPGTYIHKVGTWFPPVSPPNRTLFEVVLNESDYNITKDTFR